jgi:Kef-type K+ transport system membrane component KefB
VDSPGNRASPPSAPARRRASSTGVRLAAIIGAFLAGMIVAETKEQHPIEDEIAPLYAFFPPFFFAFIGTEVELGQFPDLATLGLLAGSPCSRS